MIYSKTTLIFSLTILVSLSICHAKDAAQQSSLTAKLMPQARTRNARSISDMFEKMKSKIFGSRKQGASASPVQPVSSSSAAQRQPWGDLNSMNQQYNPYSPLSSNYQWPVSSGQYLNQQYNPLGSYSVSQSGTAGFPGAQPQGLSSVDVQQASLNPASNSNNGPNGGLLSSASHLIAQYLSPSSSGSSGPQSSAQSGQQLGQNQQLHGQQQSLQQQQQSQYNEFASILDSMVAQTGPTSQRQPSVNQYLNNGVGSQSQQALQQQQSYQAQPGNLMGSNQMVGDTEMSGSSNVQSYMPAASPQQASQKSSMVGLAEQLAPGSQFNKLISFPFSLSNNDDPAKDGRYKLHIPFLNQHVKRSDHQVSSSAANQQRQQQYLNSLYVQQQQQQYAPNQGQQQQLVGQASQVVPSVVSPQSSSIQAQSASSSVAQSSPQSSSAIAPASSSVPQSSSYMLSPSNNPSVSSSASAQSNSRPAWSVADLQSSSSSSKLIPMPAAASSSMESASSPHS